MILYLIYGLGILTCTVSPLSRFTARLRIFHVCRNENFRNRYLGFYWKKWFYIWYVALAWWFVPCLLFPGLPHIYFLLTVRLTNEQVGVFLTRPTVQHLVYPTTMKKSTTSINYYDINIILKIFCNSDSIKSKLRLW